MGYINDYVDGALNELRNCHHGVFLGFMTLSLMFEFWPYLFFSRHVPHNFKKKGLHNLRSSGFHSSQRDLIVTYDVVFSSDSKVGRAYQSV